MILQKRKLLLSSFLILFLALSIFQKSNTQGLATDIVFSSIITISSTSAVDFAVDGDYLYIADEVEGLKIYDIAIKTSPSPVSSFPLTGASSVFVSGYSVFVTSNEGLTIIDISNPNNPIFDTTFVHSNLQNLTEVFVSGNNVFVNDKITGVWAIDLFKLALGVNYAPPANAIWFDGYFLYCSYDGSVVQISYDNAIYNNATNVGLNIEDITIHGSYGYAVGGIDGFFIYDLNNFQIINGVGTIGGESMTSLSIFGSYAFISQDLDSLRVIDVSDKTNLIDINVGDPSGKLFGLSHTYVDQNIIYTINSNNDIDIHSWDFTEVIGTNTETVTVVSSVIDTTTQNQTVTAEETITITDTQTSVKVFNISITSTFSTYLETETVTETYNTTVEFTKSTSSALTDEIIFSSNDDGGSSGIPSFMFPITVTSIILINFARKKNE